MNAWKHVVCVLQLVSNITEFFYYMHSDHTDIHINTHTHTQLSARTTTNQATAAVMSWLYPSAIGSFIYSEGGAYSAQHGKCFDL